MSSSSGETQEVIAQQQTPLVLAYDNPVSPAPVDVWKQLVGIAKYLARTETKVTAAELMTKLDLGETSLRVGLAALATLGFRDEIRDEDSAALDPITLTYDATLTASTEQQQASLRKFLASLQEEQFQRNYFCDVPVSVAQMVMGN
ncbi:MAG: hypothetical protein AAF243_09200 [Cyanobacteria bacterium P01_A01_bin.137]